MESRPRGVPLHTMADELQELIDCYLDTLPTGEPGKAEFVLPRDPEVDDSLLRFDRDGWESAPELTRQLKRHLLGASGGPFAVFDDDLAAEWSRGAASELHPLQDRAWRVRRYAKAVSEAETLLDEFDLVGDTNLGIAPPDGPPIAAQALHRL